MASKYQKITAIYESTIARVTANSTAWQAFLRSACRNYKCRFDEQILIYAQRPDAVAVLEIEKWNKLFGRWVNRGATGIAVFDDEHNGNYRLKHYFDISDTHGSRFARDPRIWQFQPQHTEAVIESLENSFGELEEKSTQADAIISAANNAVEDNLTDYLRDLLDLRQDSFLEELDELNVEVEYRNALQVSVAYMLMVRCGIDPDEHFDAHDFRHINEFNTPQTVNALGLATSDIAEMCLREIAVTIRTFAKREKVRDNKPTEKNKGGHEHDRDIDISDGGRLSGAQPDPARRAGDSPSRMHPVDMPLTTQNRIRGLVELRDCVRKLIEYQTEDFPDSFVEQEQQKLGRLYDAFSKKYDLIHSRGNSMAFAAYYGEGGISGTFCRGAGV